MACDGERFKQENYATQLVNTLNGYRKRTYMCDVVLLCRDKEFFAHKSFLCAASPYIRDYFSVSDDLASPGVKLDLSNSIPPAIMEDLLQFMYIGEVCVHKENVRELIAASDFLQMTNLKDIVCRFYEKKLCASNCLSISSLADEFNCVSLKKSADKYVCRHFVSVSQSNEFLALNVDQVVHIISRDNLNVVCEERVFEAVVNWIKRDEEERSTHLPKLLQHIRLPIINKYYIFDKVVKIKGVMEDEECKKLVLNAIEFQTMRDRRTMLETPLCSPRSSFDMINIIIACGGTQDELSSKDAMCYIPDVEIWYPLASMSCERNKSAVVLCDGYLYAIGGELDGKPLKSVECYDFATNQWFVSSDLPKALSNHSAAVLNGEIYVVGGGSQDVYLKDVLKKDKSMKQWVQVQSLKVPRRGACVVSHVHLYAIGGYGPGGMALANVERYDAYRDEWAKIFPMNSARAFASGVVIGDKIYVFGGEYAMWSFYCSAEVFDIGTDEWKAITDASIPRSFATACAVGRDIYVLGGMRSLYAGGHDDDDEFVDACECSDVEIYNIDSKEWRIGRSLPIANSGLKCIAFDTSKSVIEQRCGINFSQGSDNDDD
eukprot:gene448-1089_t